MATSPTMFRDMQNPDTPDLQFAQTISPTMFRDMQNPDTPDLPFAQSDNRSKLCYNITSSTGKTSQQVLTQTLVNFYRSVGYTVVKCSDDSTTGGGTTSNGHSHVFETLHPKQTQQLIKIGVDTTKLGVDTTVLGNKLQEAKRERDRIEDKVNANKAEHQDFHDKLQSLGDALKAHATHDIIPNPIGDILPYLLIGGIALLFLVKKK